MRRVHLVLGLAVAAVAMPAVIYAGTRIRPIHPERLNLSPAARRDEVLADLNSLLSGPATPTTIATRAYPSDELRLCRRDVIGVSYVAKDAQAPFKPEGISGVGVQYYFLGEHPPEELAARRKLCASHSDTDQQWFSSYEGHHFTADALTVLPIAIDDVRSGREVALSCKNGEGEAVPTLTHKLSEQIAPATGTPSPEQETPVGQSDDSYECDAKLFLTLAAQASTVWRCSGNVQNCYGYGMAHYMVTITLEYPGNRRRTVIKIEPEPIVLT